MSPQSGQDVSLFHTVSTRVPERLLGQRVTLCLQTGIIWKATHSFSNHWHQRGPQLGQSASIPTHFLTAGWLNSKSKHPQRIRWKSMAFLWLRFISHMVSLPTIGQGNCKGGSSSKRGDIDPTTWQKGCQCHTGRTAGGRRYIVAAIFGKYNLSQQSNYTFSKAKYNVPTQ